MNKKTTPYSLRVTAGANRGATFAIAGDAVTLGRSEQCDITIPDPLLSRKHCRFDVRGGALWVADLASANQTLVNGAAADEKELRPGDVIDVGDTRLEVLRTDGTAEPGAGPAAGPASAAGPSPDGGVVIDLGFKKPEDADAAGAAAAKRSFLRPAIWAAGAVLVLLIGATLISDMGKKDRRPPAVKPLAEDRTLLLEYESVKADADSIFRYALGVSADGTLSVRIDDVGGMKKDAAGREVSADRHVSKNKKLSPAALKRLIREIESSGFFTLEPSYTGFAASANEHEERTLTVALGKRARVCRVLNRADPDGFGALREKLETFGKNELGLWAIQFSTEKLTELARDALNFAGKKYEERDVRYANLFESLRAYGEAVFYLETVNPKPAFYDEILAGRKTAAEELDRRYGDQKFRADRAINLSDWAAARAELMILREMIPDQADARNKEAQRKLIDVEERLKKRK